MKSNGCVRLTLSPKKQGKITPHKADGFRQTGHNLMKKSLLDNGSLNLDALADLMRPPPLFEGGTVEFWADPHISKQMLTAHLSPDIDAASRKPETIERTVSWMMARLDLQPGATVLDLGCGPGLYTKRLAARGLNVTGVDFSLNSINYAREHDAATTYIHQNYLTLDFAAQFDAVSLIYGDFCVLSDEKRDQLLSIISRALKPGGRFIFDVSTRLHHQRNVGASWSVAGEGGFWRPHPHLVLEHHFHYPDDIALSQFIVVETDGRMTVYRNWFHYYSPETIRQVLEQQDFTVEDVIADLTGTPYYAETEWIGVVAQKR